MRSPRSATSAAIEREKSSRRVAELALRRALVDVGVPAADVGERDLEADVRFRELRDLPQRLAERAARVVGAVGRLVLRRVRPVLSILIALNASRPVPLSTESAAAAYSASKEAPTASLDWPARIPNCASWLTASAGAVPCSMRGICAVSATARNGVWCSACWV
jgi:hypothetical protein